ncbi:ABA4-like family protein [Archangium lansingense]|uniref:ABA4-like family protein n=1 Tax=Archangium lansingense TaxID=2995310 RepID=UPI003B76AC14
MRAETVFNVFTYGVFPAWALLVFAPRWKWTQRLVHSVLIPVMLGVAHLGLMLGLNLSNSVPEGASGASLQGAMLLFSDPWVAVLCWIHYLAFDLFAGAWIVRDARRRNIPHLAVAPCVLLTMNFGPTGLLVYLAVRFFMRRTVTLDENETAKAAAPQAHLASG